MPASPSRILFAQHGWADTPAALRELAGAVALPGATIIAPELGYLRTWHRIEPLIATVERHAVLAFVTHPEAQASIIGHSMGGLIWLELLTRHPEWLPRIDKLALLGSPVGGADLARILDPLTSVDTIARDLGIDRRAIATQVARQVPTLVLAGDSDGGSDGTITVASTEVPGTTMIVLKGVSHVALRSSPRVRAHLHRFFTQAPAPLLAGQLSARLACVPGMTGAHQRDFAWASVRLEFADGSTVRTWKNPAGVDHVFVADPRGQCVFGGFVGWLHADGLLKAIAALKHELRPYLIG